MKLNFMSIRIAWTLCFAIFLALIIVLPYYVHISRADYASETAWCTSQGGTPVWSPIDNSMAGGYWDCILPPPSCPVGYTGTPPNCTDPNAFCCSGGYCGMEPSCVVVIQSCTSAPNACGQTNESIVDGNGNCLATVPPNPAIYGTACTSAANSCGMTNTGTNNCSGVCSATTPAESLCAAYSQAAYYAQGTYYSQSSYYAQGTYAPGCTAPSVTITATPSRVKSGQTTTLTVTGTGITTSCTITGPGVNTTQSASSCGVSKTITTPAITANSVYTVTCDSGAATGKAVVNIPFGITEF